MPSTNNKITSNRDNLYNAYVRNDDTWSPTFVEQANDNSGVNSGSDTQKAQNSSSDKTTSKGKADKEFKEIEINTLVGDLIVIANERTIQIKSGDTIIINGVGKYLSGQYFIDSVTRTIDNTNGYSHSFSIIKTGFASSLKGGMSEAATVIKDVGDNNRPTKRVPSGNNTNEKSFWDTIKENIANSGMQRGTPTSPGPFRVPDSEREPIFNGKLTDGLNSNKGNAKKF